MFQLWALVMEATLYIGSTGESRLTEPFVRHSTPHARFVILHNLGRVFVSPIPLDHMVHADQVSTRLMQETSGNESEVPKNNDLLRVIWGDYQATSDGNLSL